MTPEEFSDYMRWTTARVTPHEQDPDWVEAHICLIDAVRAMIRVDKTYGDELLEEGSITRKQYDVGMAEVAKMQEWLDKLEAHEIDPTLYGTIKK